MNARLGLFDGVMGIKWGGFIPLGAIELVGRDYIFELTKHYFFFTFYVMLFGVGVLYCWLLQEVIVIFFN